jgi:transcriptional regulator with XRE-family HTH domain
VSQAVATIRVRAYRREQGLTIADLAARAGVSDTTVWRVESGRTRPHLGTILLISRALGRDAEDLFGVEFNQPGERPVAESPRRLGLRRDRGAQTRTAGEGTRRPPSAK